MARKLVWETAVWSQDLTNAGAVMSIPYSQQGYVELVTPGEVEEADRDRIWVERIVGHSLSLGFSAAIEPPPCVFKERISVGRRFDPATPTAGDVSNPWSSAESIDNFLWERPNATRFTTDTNDALDRAPILLSTDQPWWSAIDVRVGRLLEPTDFLALTLSTEPTSVFGGAFVQYYAWIRCLVSRL